MIKTNKRSRSRRKKRVISKEIARFNLFQETVAEKLTQWSDPNCALIQSQPIENKSTAVSSTRHMHSYGSKSRQKHKHSKSYNYKRRKKHRKQKRNQLYSISTTKQVASSIAKSQRRQKTDELCREIKSALTTKEYDAFRRVNHNLRTFRICTNNDDELNRFEASLIRPYAVLFNTKKRRHFLSLLATLIPASYRVVYKEKVEEIMREQRDFKIIDSDNDWKCVNCSIENISQSNECDFCGTQRELESDNSSKMELDHDEDASTEGVSSSHLEERLDAHYAQRLKEKLHELRCNMKEVDSVFSAAVVNELSECAPIEMEQLKCFAIAASDIEQYGVQIVNEIKCFLHENGLVSPFLKAAAAQSSRHCLYCENIFDGSVIARHEAECVMKDIVVSNENENENEDSISMDEEIINYFDDIDDAVFTQMIENENINDSAHAKKDEFDLKLDTTGFIDDDELLQCLLETEDTIKMKTNVKNELKQKKLELTAIQSKENEIKQQKLKIQQDVLSLQQKLDSFKY